MSHTQSDSAKIDETLYQMRLHLPYEEKIRYAETRIRQWYNHFGGMVYVAFSGGRDSQVLLHLVRRIYPEVPAVFCHEPTFPEVLDVVRNTPNVVHLFPKMNIAQIIAKHGYPVISKEVCQFSKEARSAGVGTATYRLRTTGFNSAGRLTARSRLSYKWHKLITAPFKVTDNCCAIIKKRPTYEYTKQTGRVAFVGTRASESRRRALTYKMHGCNGYTLATPRSTPLAIWTGDDVLHYIEDNGIRVAECYSMGWERTGCMSCGFGCHMRNPNQFQLLKQTHPKVHRWCMDKLGWKPVLEWLGIKTGCEEPPLTQLYLPCCSQTDVVLGGGAK